MSIAFKCTSCGRGLRANPEMAGKKTKCPGCATILTIPANGAAAAATPAKAPAAKPAPAKTSPAPAPAPAPAAGGVVTCECGAKIRTKPEWAGKAIKCPKCESRIMVPGGAPPAPKPAPAPAIEDDPFGGPGFGDSGHGGAISEDPFGGGDNFGSGFGDSTSPAGDSGFDEPAEEAPARGGRRKTAAPAPKKGGGSKVLIFGILLLALLGGGGFAGWAFFLNETPKVIPGRPIAANKDGKDDDKDEKDDKKNVGKKDPDENPIGDPKKDPKVDPVEKKDPVAVARGPLDFVPADGLGFVSIRPQELFKTSLGKKFLAKAEEGEDGKKYLAVAEAFGVGLGDIDHVVVIQKDLPEGNTLGFYIVSTNKPIKATGFDSLPPDAPKLEKKMAPGDIPYYQMAFQQGPKKGAIVLAGDHLALIGEESELLSYLAAQSPAEGPLTPLVKKAAGKHLFYSGFQVPPQAAELAKGAPPELQEIANAFTATKTGEVMLTSDKSIQALIKLNFEDMEKAEKAKDALGGLLFLGGAMIPKLKQGVPPEFEKFVKVGEDAFKSIKPRLTDKTVEVPLEVKLSLEEASELILPLIEKWMGGGKEAQQANNLRQLALAIHNYHDTFKRFPQAKIGAGLSWRVAVLPFVEEDGLHKQFKLDEPWDSDANKGLLEKMPKVYEHPTRKAPPGHTFYRVIVGPKTIFELDGNTKMTLARVSDGTSNTLLIVEAETAVPWTKFDEVVFDPDGPLPKLGEEGIFNAAFADGSVRTFVFLPPETLKALITATGGEVVDLEGKKTETKTPDTKKFPIDEGKKFELDKKVDEKKFEEKKIDDDPKLQVSPINSRPRLTTPPEILIAPPAPVPPIEIGAPKK